MERRGKFGEATGVCEQLSIGDRGFEEAGVDF